MFGSGRLRAFPEPLALAGLVAAAGLVYARGLHTALNYDEGNYLASLDSLRHGQKLGSDLFVDQPPGWYLLLRVDAFVFGNSVTGVRTGLLVFSLLGLVAAWACARSFGGPLAGLGAAALVAIAPPFPAFASRVEADPPATVLCLIALALGSHAFRGRRLRPDSAVGAGAVFALAFSVKVLATTAALPLAALALRRSDRLRGTLLLVGGAVVVFAAYLIAYAGVLHDLWTGIYTAHVHSRTHVPGPGTSDNAHRVLHFLDFHTPFGWLVPLGAAATVALRAWRLWPLWLWALAAAAFIVWQKPLLDHHFVILAAALALPAGIALGLLVEVLPRRLAILALASGAAVVGAALYQQHHQLARADMAEPPDVQWAAGELRRSTAPTDLVASDLPMVPYLADRRMPGSLIDTSVTRVVGGFTKPSEFLHLIDVHNVRAVVVGRLFLTKPEIISGLRARFRRRDTRDGVTIYLR